MTGWPPWAQSGVTLASAGRLDQALGLPGRALRDLCAAGRVRVLLPGEHLGRAVLVGRPRLPAGARAVVLAQQAEPGTLGEDLQLQVLYDDAHLLAVVKPAGLAMCPDVYHPAGTMANALRGLPGPLSSCEGPARPGIVHRLDLGTSGVIVAARTDQAHLALKAQFRAHSVQRRYLALVLGEPAWDREDVSSCLGKRRQGRKAYGSVQGPAARLARTGLRVLRRGDGVAVIEAVPQTGRTHQIRVHLAELGHPLVGDTLYGGAVARLAASLRGLRRPALHAAELGILHPASGQPLCFIAPLPADLAALMDAAAPGP